MGIQFVRDGGTRPDRITVLRFPPKRKVVFLAGGESIVRVYIHWIGESSIPCMGDECRNCHLPTRQFAYAPACEIILASNGKPQWSRGIVPITESCWEICDQAQAGDCYEVYRTGNVKNGKLRFAKATSPGVCNIRPFDVLPRLKSIWGFGTRDKHPDLSAELLDKVAKTDNE